MSDENKEVKEEKPETSWDALCIIMLCMIFSGWGFPKDTKDHELRERVARLEGQMDMIRR